MPKYLPIMRDRMARGSYRAVYEERELTRATDLCDARGRLNPAAVGWSRTPLVRANLSGHRLRKKRWNFWNWIANDFVLSATLADIDYVAFCEIAFTDFTTGETLSVRAPTRPGAFAMPEHVERSVAFRGGAIDYRNVKNGGNLRVTVRATGKGGIPVAADLVVRRPRDHETLNIVVPWTPDRFQLNAKYNTLPTTGRVTVGGREYIARPEECHAVQDFGRGVWPYRSSWNWGVATGVQDGTLIGINLGDRWTTGTGVNENALCIDGRLYKVMEDLRWEYDADDWMKPWRVVASQSRMLDLTFEPVVLRSSRLNLGVLRTGGVCCFGRWRGAIRFDGKEILIHSLVGWAEEFDHRW